MKIMCKEVVVRYKTIEVDETELGFDPEDKYYDFDQSVQDDIREEMWKQTADDGWDDEYCLESTIEVGEHVSTIYYSE
jgi:hypothetical protein